MYNIGGYFRGMKFSQKAQKQDFCVYLFATLVIHTLSNLYNIQGVIDPHNYSFAKQISSAKFANALFHKNCCQYGSLLVNKTDLYPLKGRSYQKTRVNGLYDIFW